MFNIDTIELISEYNVYQELLMAYEKQLLMEEYIVENVTRPNVSKTSGYLKPEGSTVKLTDSSTPLAQTSNPVDNISPPSSKSGGPKLGSKVSEGSKKIAKGLLNLLKKGYDLFVRFLNKLKQMFADAKKKLIDRPWFESRGYYKRITDKRVLELVKSKYKSLIFDDTGLFIQTSNARDLITTRQYLIKIRDIVESDNFSNSLKFFSKYIKNLDNDRTAISDDKLDELNKYTKINKAVGDDLKKILNNVNNSKPVKLEDIVNKTETADIFCSTDWILSRLIDEYDGYDRTFKEVLEFFEDKYGLHNKDELGLKINYNKALKLVVDHVNVITGNLKLCVELFDEYNLIEYHKFINFLYQSTQESFNTDYRQYKSEKRSEKRKANKEK